MSGRGALIAIVLAAFAPSACAMNKPAKNASWCEVVSGEQFLNKTGGAAALCKAIERAVSAQRLTEVFTVTVRVGEGSSFSADVTLADGRRLPVMSMVEFDRAMTEDTINRFGLSVAEHVADAH